MHESPPPPPLYPPSNDVNGVKHTRTHIVFSFKDRNPAWFRDRGGTGVIFMPICPYVSACLKKKTQGHFFTQKDSAWQISLDSEQLEKSQRIPHMWPVCTDPFIDYVIILQVNFKGRVIGYRAHGRVHSLKEPWVYDGMAWDVGSGINAKVKHYSNSEDAIRDAVLKVVNDLKTKGIIVDQ